MPCCGCPATQNCADVCPSTLTLVLSNFSCASDCYIDVAGVFNQTVILTHLTGPEGPPCIGSDNGMCEYAGIGINGETWSYQGNLNPILEGEIACNTLVFTAGYTKFHIGCCPTLGVFHITIDFGCPALCSFDATVS